MNSKIRFSFARGLALSLLLGIGSVAFATFADACDDRAQTKHFEVVIPGTVHTASELMQNAMPRIEIAYAAKVHAEIHEASYGLEAAAARLTESDEVDLEKVLEHSMVVLHLGSEIEDEATRDAVLPQLRKAMALALGQPKSLILSYGLGCVFESAWRKKAT